MYLTYTFFTCYLVCGFCFGLDYGVFLISESWVLAHVGGMEIINWILQSKMQGVCEILLCRESDRCIYGEAGVSLSALCLTGEAHSKHGLFMLEIQQDFWESVLLD